MTRRTFDFDQLAFTDALEAVREELASIPAEKLDKLVQRWEAIQAELSRSVSQASYVALAKEFSELNPLVQTIGLLRKARAERDQLAELLVDPAADEELATIARDELATLEPRLAELEQALRLHLLPKDAADERSANRFRRPRSRRYRGRRSGLVCCRSLPHVHALRRAARLEDRGHQPVGE